MKKLWIITEYYYPELNKVTGYYLTEIAESLSSVYEVHVMSALSDEYAAITTGNRIVHHGVSIQYINSPALNKNILFQRLIKLIYLSAMFFLGVLRNVRSGDKVIVVTNPAFMPVFISAVKKNDSNRILSSDSRCFPGKLGSPLSFGPKRIAF